MRIIAEPEILNSPVTTPGNPDQLMILLARSQPRVSGPEMESRRSGFPTDSEESVPPTFPRGSPANQRSVASVVLNFCSAGPKLVSSRENYWWHLLPTVAFGHRSIIYLSPTNFAAYTPPRRPATQISTFTVLYGVYSKY